MENKEIAELTNSSWTERVYMETSEHIIVGDIFMPKIGKKSRLLSDVLNSNKNFIAVKDCTLEYKQNPNRDVEKYGFMQVNIASILIMRPLEDE